MAANTFSCCPAKIRLNFNLLACFKAYEPIAIVTHPSLSSHIMDSGNERSGGIEGAMILGTDQHCFDVHNNGYFLHLPLRYVNGVILYMSVARMPYEPFGEFLEEKSGNFFKGQFDIIEMDACVSRTQGPPKKRYCNDFSIDEMVNWVEMEVENQARTSTVNSEYDSDFDSDDDHDYDSDSVVDYLSPGEEELIELRNRMKANRENNAKGNSVSEMNEPNNEKSIPTDTARNETMLEHDMSYGKKVVAKCGTRPPKLSDPAKGKQRKHHRWIRNVFGNKIRANQEIRLCDIADLGLIEAVKAVMLNDEHMQTIEEKLKIDAKKFNLLEINDNLFTYNTPLGVVFDEFTRLKARVCHDECEKIYAESVILINRRLVRLIDITVEKWLDLKFDDHKMVDKEIKDSVISTWLIRSYEKQFNEYMEIKRGDDEKGRDWTDMDVEKSNEMVDKIDKVLKRREQLKRLEEYIIGRPKTVNPPYFCKAYVIAP
ncbi:hypothetical protein Tco_0088179 [Tanacetum coccineum]